MSEFSCLFCRVWRAHHLLFHGNRCSYPGQFHTWSVQPNRKISYGCLTRNLLDSSHLSPSSQPRRSARCKGSEQVRKSDHRSTPNGAPKRPPLHTQSDRYPFQTALKELPMPWSKHYQLPLDSHI